MSDFGSRGGGVDATAAKQDVQEVSLDAIQAGVEALSATTVVTPVNNQVFDDVQSSYTSPEIACSGYRKVLIRIILGVTLAPGTIKINLQFSEGGATYENYTRGPFGSLMYEDTAGAKAECIEAPIMGSRLKINVVTTGTGAANKFALTCKLNGMR
jgi:hypothetical protein